jgi:hypothetical protein
MLKTMIAVALATTVAAVPAVAEKGGKGNGNGKGRGEVHASQGFCPPGLAKKDPPCVPPGQARKAAGDDRDHDDHDHDHDHDHDYVDHDHDHDVDLIRVGDLIDDRFVFVPDPTVYGLTRDYFYYRALDRIFRVDPETRQVLAVIGLVDTLVN